MKTALKLCLLVAGFSALSGQSAGLALNMAVTRIDVSQDGQTWVQLTGAFTVNLLDGTVKTTGQSVPSNLSSLLSGQYRYMRMYVTHVDFEEGGTTQHYETTLASFGIPLNPVEFTSEMGENEQGRLFMMPFLIGQGGAPSIQINLFLPTGAITGSSIGGYGINQPPAVSVEVTGAVGGSVGSISGTISGTTAGKTLFIGASTESNPNSPPDFGLQLASQAGSTSFTFSQLPFGTYFLSAFEDQDPTDQGGRQEPNFSDAGGNLTVDKFGLSNSSGIPSDVAVSASNPDVPGVNFAIAQMATNVNAYGCRIADPNATATLMGGVKSELTGINMTNGKAFVGVFKLDNTQDADSGTGGVQGEVDYFNGGPTSSTRAMNVITSVFSTHSQDFFMTFVAVSGSPFVKDWTIDGIPAGTYLIAGFLDLNGNGNPDTGDRFEWNTQLKAVANNALHAGADLVFDSSSDIFP